MDNAYVHECIHLNDIHKLRQDGISVYPLQSPELNNYCLGKQKEVVVWMHASLKPCLQCANAANQEADAMRGFKRVHAIG